MPSIAPMLEKLGYDPTAYPPKYGDADHMVAQNTLLIKNNEDYWRRKSLQVQQLPPKTAKSYATLHKGNESLVPSKSSGIASRAEPQANLINNDLLGNKAAR